jgi:hypothetical protein
LKIIEKGLIFKLKNRIFVAYFDRFEYDATKLLKENLFHIVQVFSCQELENKIVFTLEYCNQGV